MIHCALSPCQPIAFFDRRLLPCPDKRLVKPAPPPPAQLQRREGGGVGSKRGVPPCRILHAASSLISQKLREKKEAHSPTLVCVRRDMPLSLDATQREGCLL